MALILLAGVTVSCKDKTPVDEPVSTGDVTEDVSDGAPTPIMADFGDYEFRVLTRGSGGWQCDDISGMLTGTIAERAVYERNQILKNKYNFRVVEEKAGDWVTRAETTSAAAQDVFDMWSFRMNDMPGFGQKGYLYNLNEVDGINLDAPYYDQNLRKQGSFANYLFFLTGDMVYMDDMSTAVFMFNKTMWDNERLTEEFGMDMYGLVDSGNWTLENFEKIAKALTKDEGDGVMNEKDQYGFSYQNADILALNIAANNELLTKNDEDVFVLNQDARMINCLEKIMNFLNTTYSSNSTDSPDLWTAGRQFIDMVYISYLPKWNNVSFEFGVVPPCKIDTAQENYRAFITTFGSNSVTICSTVKDVDRTANIIELMSYESMNRVTPKFNEYLFGGRLTQREADQRMLNIIMNNRRYELCYLWSTGSLYSTMVSVKNADGVGIASALKSCESAVAASIDRKLERLNNIG